MANTNNWVEVDSLFLKSGTVDSTVEIRFLCEEDPILLGWNRLQADSLFARPGETLVIPAWWCGQRVQQSLEGQTHAVHGEAPANAHGLPVNSHLFAKLQVEAPS